MTDLITSRREIALTHRNFTYELPPLLGTTFHVRVDFAGIEFIAELAGLDPSKARILFVVSEVDNRVLFPVSLGLITSMTERVYAETLEVGP